jgi:hypothetical protein
VAIAGVAARRALWRANRAGGNSGHPWHAIDYNDKPDQIDDHDEISYDPLFLLSSVWTEMVTHTYKDDYKISIASAATIMPPAHSAWCYHSEQQRAAHRGGSREIYGATVYICAVVARRRISKLLCQTASALPKILQRQ